MKMLGINLALALAWCAMAGSLTLGNLLLGFIAALGILAWLDVDGAGRRYALRFPTVLVFAAVYAADIVRSSARVAWDVLTISSRRKPAILEVPLQLETQAELALLANLVTFTPGTLALDLDLERRVLTIHGMFVADPEATRADVARFETWVRRILR